MIQFSNNILKESVDDKFFLEGNLKIKKEWRDDKKLRITVMEYPDLDKKYRILAENIRTKWYIPIKSGINFDFTGVIPPNVEKINPENNAEGVLSDSKISVELDRPMGEEYFLEFKSSPSISFDYSIDEKRKNLEIIEL